MPKRMRDTETYKDRFVKGLPPDYKHLWFYILDDCDHAGIWRVDLEGASLYTGCQFTEAKALELLASKVEQVNQDYWFVPAFLKFQYGTTPNPSAGVVVSARKRLAEFNLQDRLGVGSSKGPGTLSTHSPSQEGLGTPKNKSKSKDKDKSKDDEGDFGAFWQAYPKQVGKDAAAEAWAKAKPPLQEALAALQWQRRSWDWTKDAGQFIPNPATYLNHGRWKDPNPDAPKSSYKAPTMPQTIKVIDETAEPMTESFKRAVAQ